MPITPFDRDSAADESAVIAIAQMGFEKTCCHKFRQLLQLISFAEDVHRLIPRSFNSLISPRRKSTFNVMDCRLFAPCCEIVIELLIALPDSVTGQSNSPDSSMSFPVKTSSLIFQPITTSNNIDNPIVDDDHG